MNLIKAELLPPISQRFHTPFPAGKIPHRNLPNHFYLSSHSSATLSPLVNGSKCPYDIKHNGHSSLTGDHRCHLKNSNNWVVCLCETMEKEDEQLEVQHSHGSTDHAKAWKVNLNWILKGRIQFNEELNWRERAKGSEEGRAMRKMLHVLDNP